MDSSSPDCPPRKAPGSVSQSPNLPAGFTSNELPADFNEALVRGREEIFFPAEFDASSGSRKLADDVVAYYIDVLASDPDALRGSFEFYRALADTGAQNHERKARPLALPVLAIGGAESTGDAMGSAVKLVAEDVQIVVLPGAGHWIAEQAPEALLAALTEFLAPFRSAPRTLATV